METFGFRVQVAKSTLKTILVDKNTSLKTFHFRKKLGFKTYVYFPLHANKNFQVFYLVQLTLRWRYMISVCLGETSSRPAETDLTLRLRVEIKFCPGISGQFSTWHLFRFVCNFFEFFIVTMSVDKIENP